MLYSDKNADCIAFINGIPILHGKSYVETLCFINEKYELTAVYYDGTRTKVRSLFKYTRQIDDGIYVPKPNFTFYDKYDVMKEYFVICSLNFYNIERNKFHGIFGSVIGSYKVLRNAIEYAEKHGIDYVAEKHKGE